jgi:integrase/recombinase XerC
MNMVSYFLQHIRYEKRLSHHTVTAYEGDLEQFSSFLQNQYEIAEVSKADFQMIRSWIVNLVDSKNGTPTLENRSVNRKIATLRTFFEFLLRHKVITANPMLKIKALKTDKPLPKYIEEKSMEMLLNDVEFSEDFSDVRDKLVLELLYGTGMRLSELIGLKISDINLFNGTFSVLGKRNKQRIIPINKPLIELIKSYLLLREKQVQIVDNEQLIITDTGTEAYPMFIQRLVKKHLSVVTTLQQKSPHIMRHTFATHLLNRGADLNAIKDLLGHSSLAATQIYTHNSIEILKKVYEKAHPKA